MMFKKTKTEKKRRATAADNILETKIEAGCSGFSLES
jgi:hypothetical protein